MEFSNPPRNCSPSSHTLLNSNQQQIKDDEHHTADGWTFEENKLFEEALAQYGEPLGSYPFFQHVGVLLPLKSMDSIKIHYQALMEDLDLIESSKYGGFDNYIKEQDKHPPKKNKVCEMQQRKRRIMWTEEEHLLFLMGIEKYGRGQWKKISSDSVITKTPQQVASHAQKYFNRKNCSTPPDKRRDSINDIKLLENHCTFSNFRLSHAKIAGGRIQFHPN